MLYSYYGVGDFERIVTPDPVTGKEVGSAFPALFAPPIEPCRKRHSDISARSEHENYGGLQVLT